MRGRRVSDYKSLRFLPSPCFPSLPPPRFNLRANASFTAVFPAVSATIFYSELKSEAPPSIAFKKRDVCFEIGKGDRVKIKRACLRGDRKMLRRIFYAHMKQMQKKIEKLLYRKYFKNLCDVK